MRQGCSAVRQVSSRGFTLVELLVVMALLSLVMLALASALSTAAQTEERVDARLARADELRVANDFLHAVLGRVSARKNAALQAAGESEYLFKGEGQTVQWVGIMPARHGAGGRYHFRLQMEGWGGEPALVVRFAPWTDDATLPDWSSADSYVLAKHVRGAAFQYLDLMAEPPVWLPQWTEPKRLPDRVMLTVQTAAGPWPDIVVAMRIAPQSDPRSAGAVFGGTR